MYVIQLNGGCLLNGANICKNIIFFDIKVSFCLGKYTFLTRKSEVKSRCVVLRVNNVYLIDRRCGVVRAQSLHSQVILTQIFFEGKCPF